MAVSSFLTDISASGELDGSFLDDAVVSKLAVEIGKLGVESLLDLSLLFDFEGDRLRAEVWEFVIGIDCGDATHLFFTAVSMLKVCGEELMGDDFKVLRPRLRKRKLNYGRMVVDSESEATVRQPCVVRPLLPGVSLLGRGCSETALSNVRKPHLP